ncbi:hypothetical protein BBK82_42880 [Lentzea guizhouensis]|uniref:Uncharacterized protein n=1 Tax=Lentzea guizhouensis TaxID=1586287 RepID=A0A1B2HVD6_9PSEU|nr:hypothetical protein [Lentzea guizhouensis]ANZ41699.1 hypothetical protein BBK82_42880 [Lentzea guizhouensis]
MSDDLGVLTAIYQSDRADRSTTLTVSLATMGAAVTYLVGTIAFYDKLDLLGWAISLLPFPLVCIAAFHAVLLNLAAVRARSILTLERALLDRMTGPDASSLDRGEIGVTASEKAGNLHTAHPAQRAAILIAYGGVGTIYLGYIGLMLVKAAPHLSGWIAVPAAGYASLLVPVALAWRHSTANFDFEHAGRGRRRGAGNAPRR